MTEHVVVERDGPVQLIRLNRPDKMNALTGDMYDRMAGALKDASADGEIAVTILLGLPGIFCAGNDIGDFMAAIIEETDLETSVLSFLREITISDCPLVVGIDGPAIGIGTTLLLHCDHVIASERSSFRTPFVDLGLVPEAGSSLLMPRLIGHARAFDLLVMGKEMKVDVAHATGLINRVTTSDQVEPECRVVAEDIAGRARDALVESRRLLKHGQEEVLERVELEAKRFFERLRSPQARAAFEAFLAKA